MVYVELGKSGCRVLHDKGEKDQRKVQKPAFMMVWGCISVHGMGDLHIDEGTIDMEPYIEILCCLFLEHLWIFQQDIFRPHSPLALFYVVLLLLSQGLVRVILSKVVSHTNSLRIKISH